MALVPFDDRDGLIWWDGELIDWRDAKLHVLSHGLHYASAVFEGEGGLWDVIGRHDWPLPESAISAIQIAIK